MHDSESTESSPILAIGLMSGTSADGVDAALVRTNGDGDFDFRHAITIPYDRDVRESLLALAQNDVPLNQLLRIERRMTDVHVEACHQLIKCAAISRNDVNVVGFHGHTIRHLPNEQLTWQIGDASRLACSLSLPVISDFRRHDLAAGGQGAPLAALFHREMMSQCDKPTMVLNLGGVANITWIGEDDQILAGDTGPGCGLLDAWIVRHTGQPFDEDGRISGQGSVLRSFVRATMEHEFFHTPLPKSADRFDFDFVDVSGLSTEDGAATLCAITVAGIASVAEQVPVKPKSVWVTGGGAKNATLMQFLRERFLDVYAIDEAGLRPNSLEAECFAWLAVRRLRGLPTSYPETTGCRQPTCGGLLTR